ncbi:hypothetical protein GIB67_036253 [Kingdonia uniflora]|uniref:Cyclin-dependent kinase inhibitor domain-containing protein n=1 Tax=Kingdonia uniflora TaxID=39325 RepID=A0A7J7P9C5_9MAGN|nr:hypothetical protein GIB67_036253 [Kingdonia uniflora]
MGKYMRKAKITREVAVMDLSLSHSHSHHHQSSLGVRTRARTLALQRLQQTPTPTTTVVGTPAATTTTNSNSDTSYLQLRSRRLEKPPLGRKQQIPKESCKQISISSNPNPNSNSRIEIEVNSVSVAGSVEKKEEGFEKNVETATAEVICDDEASFGENCLEIDEGRERGTRETTPCSLIRDSDTVLTPGSTTRPTSSTAANRRMQNVLRRNFPTTREMDEFFAGAEQQQQRVFKEKYNFDPVNESPLPGPYEWERVDP